MKRWTDVLFMRKNIWQISFHCQHFTIYLWPFIFVHLYTFTETTDVYHILECMYWRKYTRSHAHDQSKVKQPLHLESSVFRITFLSLQRMMMSFDSGFMWRWRTLCENERCTCMYCLISFSSSKQENKRYTIYVSS